MGVTVDGDDKILDNSFRPSPHDAKVHTFSPAARFAAKLNNFLHVAGALATVHALNPEHITPTFRISGLYTQQQIDLTMQHASLTLGTAFTLEAPPDLVAIGTLILDQINKPGIEIAVEATVDEKCSRGYKIWIAGSVSQLELEALTQFLKGRLFGAHITWEHGSLPDHAPPEIIVRSLATVSRKPKAPAIRKTDLTKEDGHYTTTSSRKDTAEQLKETLGPALTSFATVDLFSKPFSRNAVTTNSPWLPPSSSRMTYPIQSRFILAEELVAAALEECSKFDSSYLVAVARLLDRLVKTLPELAPGQKQELSLLPAERQFLTQTLEQIVLFLACDPMRKSFTSVGDLMAVSTLENEFGISKASETKGGTHSILVYWPGRSAPITLPVDTSEPVTRERELRLRLPYTAIVLGKLRASLKL